MVTKNILTLLFFIFFTSIQEIEAATCDDGSSQDCFITGLMFNDLEAVRKGCRLGHAQSCGYAGWNKRVNQSMEFLSPEEAEFFKNGCNLNDANCCYNYAGFLAARGKTDEAIVFLEKSLNLDFTRWDLADEDPDFNSIRRKNEFQILLFRYRDL